MSDSAASRLRALVESDWRRPIPQPVEDLAQAAIAGMGGRGVVAVLFYGSCFRDGVVGDGLVDLYLVAESYGSVHRRPWVRLFNWLVPPNVYYAQCESGGRMVRGKFAVVSIDQLEKRTRPETGNPYFWARFAQPTGIVFCEPAYEQRLKSIFVMAIRTLYDNARATAGEDALPLELWTGVLKETYRTELRVEKTGRAEQIYQSDRERFDAIDRVLRSGPFMVPGSALKPPGWRQRRLWGRILSVLRLVKAAFTFSGGADYLVWKIERHSGVRLALADWQRRHPILAAGPILWRLWRAKIVS